MKRLRTNQLIYGILLGLGLIAGCGEDNGEGAKNTEARERRTQKLESNQASRGHPLSPTANNVSEEISDNRPFLETWKILEKRATSLEQQQLLFGEFAFQAAKQGRFSEAKALIMSRLGEGFTRQHVITCLFEGVDSNLAEAFILAKSSPADDFRKGAYSGILPRLAKGSLRLTDQEPPEQLDSSEIEIITAALVFQVFDSHGEKTPRPELFNQALKDWNHISSHLKSGQRSSMLTDLLARSGENYPMETWRYAISEKSNLNQNQLEKIAKGSARVLINKSPEDAMKLAYQEGFGEVVLFGEWAARDVDQAQKWLILHKGKLSDPAQNKVFETLAKQLTGNKKFSAAQEWIRQISDEATKQRSIQGIAQFRTAGIQKQVKSDPLTTVENLQAENHLESPILMGVAINEWLNQEPDDAGKWFFNNSKDMRPAERDYSAEAFVKYGIKVGDLDAARQWADQHSSPEKRREYHKQIDHAAVEKKYNKQAK